MIKEHMSIEQCVATIMATLPVCKVRDIAYSTFTIIQITNNDYAEIIQYDNPPVILLRNGKNFDYPIETRIISGKKILESKIKLEQDDVFITMSDGAIYAGVGQILNYGWQRENIIQFAEANYNYKNSAQFISSSILDACNDLYANKPGDDTTVAAVQLRKRITVNLLFGPPENPKDVNNMMLQFFEKKGMHIVSGGTTSTLAAEFLEEELEVSIDYYDPIIPPTAKIKGVDLVTEGVLTINQVLKYAKDYVGENKLYNEWRVKEDGASQIARLLFEKATDINFYVGRAKNPAHQNVGMPIDFNIKMQLAEELSKILRPMGKTIHLTYF
jgi:hypothetical protein